MGDNALLKKLTDELKEETKDVTALINAVADEKSFVEYDRFLRGDTPLGAAVGEGAVSGFCSVGGIDVGIFATNPAVLKGAIGKRNAQKIVKCVDNAVAAGNPVIGIYDTKGARLAEGIGALEGYGAVTAALSDAYGRVPVICVVKGASFGLSAYFAAVCDVCIGFDKSSLCTSSPLIISAKAGVDENKVGSAKIHAEKTGLYSITVKNERELAAALKNALNLLSVSVEGGNDDVNRVCKTLKGGVKAAALIKEIFDTGTFLELKPDFAPVVITGLARLNGIAVGVCATDSGYDGGRLTSNACVKIGELYNTCEAFGLPIVNLVDCAGAVEDIAEENSSLIREVGNVMYLSSQLTVGRAALVYGKAIGAGYTAFASKAAADYTLCWPDAQIGAVDSVKAAELLYRDEIAKAKNKAAALEKLAAAYAAENTAATAVCGEGYIDNIIEPQFSRGYLAAAVMSLAGKE
ncbi:MAG: hypothetical protein LBP26_07590 [Clostridiales bacterium]|nr:hypothetical protein [Clostridiales bacterium]